VDDETFDQREFLKRVAESPNCPRSACPSPELYKEFFERDFDHVYAVTLSAALSGSYNSAEVGKSMALEENPDRKIYVFNSRSASIGQTLIARKIGEYEEEGLPFEEIIEKVEQYIASQTTWFVLESLEHLRKNGRLSNFKAFVATALKIKPICSSTPEGEIQQVGQARGINRALVRMVEMAAESAEHMENKEIAVSHVNNPERGQMVLDAIRERVKAKGYFVENGRGVTSLYSSDGGIILVL
jgi:DegV family protein with EDD domain